MFAFAAILDVTSRLFRFCKGHLAKRTITFEIITVSCFKNKKQILKINKKFPIKKKKISRSHTGSRTRAAWVKTRNPNR